MKLNFATLSLTNPQRLDPTVTKTQLKGSSQRISKGLWDADDQGIKNELNLNHLCERD